MPAACGRRAACPTRVPVSPTESCIHPPRGHSSRRDTEGIREGLESGELQSLILFGVDPLRDFPDTEAWKRALAAADHLVVFSTFENQTTAMADVVFPIETHAEKDGTVTHPDGRLQRVRPSAARPGDIRPNWGVLAELSLALGHDTGVYSQPTAFAALTEAVPFYAGITDADIGGRGIRWQDGPTAATPPQPGGDGGTTSRESAVFRRGGATISFQLRKRSWPSAPTETCGSGRSRS